ncbi:MAG: hypothetical protein JSS76_18555 [Bacteroidetes bacterium]|nr:hypothetical protein [Bacteroidota bacterium]MBS1686745.1 hypothetical protein [Bacteroidota bacterium]
MKRRMILITILMVSALSMSAMRHQRDTASIKPFHRFYISWGYVKAWYSTSDIYFKGAFNGNSYNFVVTNAIAHDRPDMHAIFPQVTIPQYVYRIGYFFDKKRVWAIEFNFDHTKYIVDNYRTAHVSGTINGQTVNGDKVLDPNTFLHFEHTNGANFYLINGVRRLEIWKSRRHRFRLNDMVKLGVGWMIPKTDVTLFGQRLDNKFHVAGYMFGLENSLRLNLGRWFFIEPSVKGCFVDYRDVLTVQGGKAHHSFWAFEAMGTFGVTFL